MTEQSRIWTPRERRIVAPNPFRITGGSAHFPPIPRKGLNPRGLIGGTRFPLMAPFGTAGAVSMANRRLGAGATPGTILNPVGWWRADLGHAVADAASVPAWANQGSDSGLDLANATSAQQPTYDEDNATFNNQASMHFASTQRIYSGATAAWELADGGDMTCIVVMSVDTAATHYGCATDGSTGFLRFAARSGGASVQNISDSGGTTTTISGSSLSTGTLYVQANTLLNNVSAATDTHSHFLDGVADGTDTTHDLNLVRPSGGSGAQEFIVGSWRVVSGVLIGDIAEIIYHKALMSAGEEADMVTYINARYGLSLTALV